MDSRLSGREHVLAWTPIGTALSLPGRPRTGFGSRRRGKRGRRARQATFTALRYGQPGYCRLADVCALEIRTGADDESECGVFHDLFQPQREATLAGRLGEYVPSGIDAAVIHST